MNKIPEGYRQVKGIELFFSDIIVCSKLLLLFMGYKLRGNNGKAQESFMWLKFFWNCKPECVCKPIKK